MKRFMLWMVAGLLVVQTAYAEEEGGAEKNWWGGVSLKYWMASFTNAGASSVANNEYQGTVALGYDKYFITWTGLPYSLASPMSSPYGGGSMIQGERAFGLGYNINSNFSVVLGIKELLDFYSGLQSGTTISKNGTSYGTLGTATYNTVAVLGNWKIPDTKLILVGNLSVGQGTSNVSGDSASHQYLGGEFGVSYLLLDNWKAGVGYKYEQLDTPHPANPLPVFGRSTKSGLFANVGWSF